jgi:peptidoglycan hydrolase-like protein with peptidoglycan-binding domain
MDRLEFDIAPFAVREETEARVGPIEGRRNRSPQRMRPSTRRPPPASPHFASPPAPCVCPAHDTEFVRWLQSALNRIEGAGLPVDGEMSAAARSVLRRFQRRRRLPVDGIVGPATEQALREARRPAHPQPEPARGPGEIYQFETLDLESPSSMPTLRQGSRGSAVADLQRRLDAAGFSSGAADGVFGPLTDAAVRSFQRARGLGVDGIVGPQTWGALLGTSTSVPGAYVPWPQPASASDLSGAHWVAQFPGSKTITSLVEPFRSNVARFVSALEKAGVTPDIKSTLRPPQRAYLMHWSWMIAKAGLSPTAVPPYSGGGLNIRWAHTDSKGNLDLTASRAAAQDMADSYGLTVEPSLTSLHILGRAIDMSIEWNGNLVIPDAGGAMKTITSSPRNGGFNRDLWAVGASYGVLKLVGDAPHWSDNGS